MINYSKWDNLDSGDSDSDDGPPPRTEAQRRQLQAQGQQQQRNGGDDKRSLVQAELLRVRGNTAFERGELATAVGAYEAQLQVLDGCKDDEAVEMVWGALLNQASALIRLKNFREVEARCSRLLAMPSAGGGGGDDGGRSAAARGRAFHFRGFSRLRRGMHEEACSDFRSALSTGTSGVEEARALLAEAEAGLALSSCLDPEAKGRELLRQGEGREAAEHFRDAASRARLLEDVGQDGAPKGQGGGTGGQRAAGGGSVDAGVARARLSRMQAVGSAMAGDGSSAEMLLRGGLQELRAGPGGEAMSSEQREEEGLTQAALGSLLAQERNHAEAVVLLRAAIVALDGVITDVPTGGKEQSRNSNISSNISDGSSSIESSLSTAAEIYLPSPPPSKTARKGLTRTLTATLAFLGTSLLALDRQPDTSTNDTSASEGNTSAADGGGGGGSGGSARPGPEGKRGMVTGGSGGVQGPAVVADSPAAAAAAAVVAAAPASVGDLYEEAVHVLKRALGMLRIEAASLAAAEAAASASAVGSAPESASVASRDGGVDRRKEDVAAETARVLDALSEAYARARRWEQARSAAELSLTAWRSLGDAGRAGASTSLLSIGHLVLELHGVGGGIEEASARWEEAARCFNGCARPSDEAEVRVNIAGFYSKVARSDPSRLESLSEKIAAHYSAAAGFFAREREEAISSLERAAKAVTIAEESSSSAAEDQRPPPPPSTDGSLGSGGLSPWELAEKEASAWEGFAGAVGDDHEEAARALRKAEGLLNVASVSEKDDSWRLKKIEVLSSLALAVARCGEHKMAEDKLLVAIAEFQQLDGVSAIAGGGAHQDVLVNLLKYLAVARRARGDIPGAREALAKVEALGGSESREHVQDLNRLLSTNSFPVTS